MLLLESRVVVKIRKWVFQADLEMEESSRRVDQMGGMKFWCGRS